MKHINISGSKDMSSKLEKTTMASLLGAAEHAGLCQGLADMEDEDDLFEIDLDSADSIPPQPHYYWDNYFTTTSKTLLANCLLPVTDISRAIPMVPKALPSPEGAVNVVKLPETMPLGKLLGLPFLEAVVLHQKEVKQKWKMVGENDEAHRLDVGGSEPLEGRY